MLECMRREGGKKRYILLIDSESPRIENFLYVFTATCKVGATIKWSVLLSYALNWSYIKWYAYTDWFSTIICQAISDELASGKRQ